MEPRRGPLTVLLATLAVGAACDPQSPAAGPGASITLGWAVDTGVTPTRDIVRTVAAYYRLPERGRARTTLWIAEDQRGSGRYDLTPDWVYQPGFSATIGSVIPASADSSLWLVRTLFASADSGEVQPLALHRLYAQRAPPGSGAPYGWQLSGSIRHLGGDYLTRQVGPIVYHFPLGHRYRPDLAARAVAFIDASARRIGVSPPARLDYYISATWEESERLVNIDWAPNRMAWAGRAYSADRMVFAGNPALGEAFTHELAHVVLGALPGTVDRHPVIEEALATWLGGGNRGPLSLYYELLRDFQRAHPDATVADVLGNLGSGRDAELYATGALLVEGVYRRGGPPALRRLAAIQSGESKLLATVGALLGIDAGGLDAWWRQEAATADAP